MFRCIRSERGTSLVEAALFLPLLMLLTLVTADVGRGFTTFIALSNASREGARWISLNPTDNAGALNRIAVEAAQVGLTPGAYTPTITTLSDPAGDAVTVTVAHDYPLLFGAIINPLAAAARTAVPTTLNFSTQTTMRILYN